MKWLPAVVVIAMLMAEAQCKLIHRYQNRNQYETNMRQFLNTTEPIWTVNTTEPVNISCKVDVRYNWTTNATYFNRSYYYEGNKTQYPVQGTFVMGLPDMILIGMPEGLADGYEVLVYQGLNNTCGVINVTIELGGQGENVFTWFDMRVRNSSIGIGATDECRIMYDGYRGPQRTKGIYNETCQRILAAKTILKTPHYLQNPIRDFRV